MVTKEELLSISFAFFYFLFFIHIISSEAWRKKYIYTKVIYKCIHTYRVTGREHSNLLVHSPKMPTVGEIGP